MYDDHLPYWLAALFLPGIGPRKLQSWLGSFVNIKTLFHASEEEWHAAGISTRQIQLLQRPDWEAVEYELAWAQKTNHHLISLEDKSYPPLLKETADPPLVLYVRGNREALMQAQIAIVGSRNASPAGIANAEQFAKHLAAAGFAITSGLALGIDGGAHRGALAGGGVTLGVSGTGLNYLYPRSHHALVDSILHQGGAVISEFPLRTPPKATNFPQRNRIIAGLSLGVLVIEAALKSGSLITARNAIEEGREVFAIPGSIHHPLSRGSHYLIRQGAKLVETAEDVIEELGALRAGLVAPVTSQRVEPPFGLSADYRQLLEQIGYEITPIDVILLRSGLTAGEVSSMLLALELNGYIQSVPGGYIRTVSRL
ncbi:DNA-processing protein DprA [Aquicella lusitana]|uniref:DNA protecting protein DprA n=1 Tax=Aquicella lusitana TaxID=254246 RepID=A0A370G2F2_9COXI|nr:DNA-processing protein DprA [Aquicella lusitana]RDI38051.1 DNA protecting protein DprA [Aquicella lusitana]VVC72649.1 hypothetical protein AQULUS_03630 [Aquicella lusitana]